MTAKDLRWEGYEVDTAEAIWVCTKSSSAFVGFTSANTLSIDGIDYFLDFTARDKRVADVPDQRTLHLRTSAYLVATDLAFLQCVVDGQILQPESWDQFKEVYKRD